MEFRPGGGLAGSALMWRVSGPGGSLNKRFLQFYGAGGRRGVLRGRVRSRKLLGTQSE